MLSFKNINRITIGSILFLLPFAFFFENVWYLLVAVLFCWFVITGLGSAFIGWNYHLKAINANYKTTEKAVAITFDDGPNEEFTPKVLALLEKYNAKATFFCIGNHIEAHPDVFKMILQKGHTVGNHTYSHSNYFGFFSTNRVMADLAKTNALIHKLVGKEVIFYRPAFGVTNPKIRNAVKQLNLLAIGWSIRSLDTTSRDVKAVFKRVTKHVKAGDIILLHDTSDKTLVVLEQLLLFLHHKNLTSVTIDTLCNKKAYV